MKETEYKVTDYNEELQRLFLQIMISEPELYTRCQNIVRDSYFNSRLRKTVRFIQEYAEEYKSVPSSHQIKAMTGETIEAVSVSRDAGDWFLHEIESFCRHKEIESIIVDGPDVLAQGLYSTLEERIKKAMTITLQKDLGTDYFAEPRARLEKVRENQKPISTGWKYVDEKLYGGWGRKTLNIFAGQPGAGKSLFLQNISLNYIDMGLNVVYITLELSEELVSMRFDGMVAEYSMKEIFKNLDEVELKVATYKKSKKPGSLRIKKLPEGGTTTNDIRAFLKEYEIQTGIRPDVVVVDYLDLVAPNNKKINPTDLFVKDKFVSEELRALSFELDCILVTASQLNRGSSEVVEFDMSHIAGGISKLNTADNLIAIMSTPSMREQGQYQLQFLKTRSSAGVGSKVNLKFDVRTLRITDHDDEDGSYRASSRDNLENQLKKHISSTIVAKSDQNALANANAAVIQNGAYIRDRLKSITDN